MSQQVFSTTAIDKRHQRQLQVSIAVIVLLNALNRTFHVWVEFASIPLPEKILVKFSTHLDYISSCKKESSKPKLELRDLRTRSVRGLVVMIVACQGMVQFPANAHQILPTRIKILPKDNKKEEKQLQNAFVVAYEKCWVYSQFFFFAGHLNLLEVWHLAIVGCFVQNPVPRNPQLSK